MYRKVQIHIVALLMSIVTLGCSSNPNENSGGGHEPAKIKKAKLEKTLKKPEAQALVQELQDSFKELIKVSTDLDSPQVLKNLEKFLENNINEKVLEISKLRYAYIHPNFRRHTIKQLKEQFPGASDDLYKRCADADYKLMSLLVDTANS